MPQNLDSNDHVPPNVPSASQPAIGLSDPFVLGEPATEAPQSPRPVVDLDRQKKELENQKLQAEIAQLAASRKTNWITPTAFALLLPLVGSFAFSIYNEVAKYSEALSSKAERDKLRLEKISLQQDKLLINSDVMRLSAVASHQEAESQKREEQLALLREKQNVAQTRFEAERVIELHGSPIQRDTNAATGEVTLNIKLREFKNGGDVHKALETLCKFDSISALEVSFRDRKSPQEAEEHVRVLVALLQNEPIVHLTVLDTQMGDDGVAELARLGTLKRITLNPLIQNHGTSEESVTIERGRPTLIAQESLSRGSNVHPAYTHSGMRRLSQTMSSCYITYGPPSFHLAVSRHHGRGDESIQQAIVDVAVEERVGKSEDVLDSDEARSLDLTVTQVDDEDLRQLVGFYAQTGGKKLVRLDLPATISAEGLQHLRDLPSLEDLRFPEYSVGRWQLGDAALKQIGTVPTLKRLRVTGSFSEVGVSQLAELSRLRELDIGSQFITHEGLSELKRLKALRRLTLRDVLMSEKAIKALGEFSQLEELNVKRTEISPNQEAVLRLRLPQCRIIGRRDSAEFGGST